MLTNGAEQLRSSLDLSNDLPKMFPGRVLMLVLISALAASASVLSQLTGHRLDGYLLNINISFYYPFMDCDLFSCMQETFVNF